MKKILTMFISISVCASSLLYRGVNTYAGNEYERTEQTESEEVIRITEEISEIYQICPELVQALIFYESSNRSTAVSGNGCIGYMQIAEMAAGTDGQAWRMRPNGRLRQHPGRVRLDARIIPEIQRD